MCQAVLRIKLLLTVYRSLKSSIVLRLTNIIPGTIVDRRRCTIGLNPSPPKPMNNGRYFLNEGLGEKDSAHVVDRDGGKDRFNVNKSAGMIQFVGLDGGKLCPKFVEDKLVGFVVIPVIEN
jgi:hypothetical protein